MNTVEMQSATMQSIADRNYAFHKPNSVALEGIAGLSEARALPEDTLSFSESFLLIAALATLASSIAAFTVG